MPKDCSAAYALLEERIGYRFKDRSLLRTALTHSSRAAESPGAVDNERLEFLGDAVLDFHVSALLYKRMPEAHEGVLSLTRAALVNETTLATIAASLGIGDLLSLGRGEERSGGRVKRSLLADAFEALVAAVFLDGGYRAAAGVVSRQFAPLMQGQSVAGARQRDFKTELQELTQSRSGVTPAYELVAFSGPDHARSYTVAVLVDGAVLGEGTGQSKKAAQQAAAEMALGQLQAVQPK